jgi:hypothetical protein
MSNSVSTEGHYKRGDCSGVHHMGRENHNYLLLLIPSLSLRYFYIPLFLTSTIINRLTPESRILEKLILHSSSQEIPCLLWNPKGSLLCSQQPVTDMYDEPDKSNHKPKPYSL